MPKPERSDRVFVSPHHRRLFVCSLPIETFFREFFQKARVDEIFGLFALCRSNALDHLFDRVTLPRISDYSPNLNRLANVSPQPIFVGLVGCKGVRDPSFCRQLSAFLKPYVVHAFEQIADLDLSDTLQ